MAFYLVLFIFQTETLCVISSDRMIISRYQGLKRFTFSILTCLSMKFPPSAVVSSIYAICIENNIHFSQLKIKVSQLTYREMSVRQSPLESVNDLVGSFPTKSELLKWIHLITSLVVLISESNESSCIELPTYWKGSRRSLDIFQIPILTDASHVISCIHHRS